MPPGYAHHGAAETAAVAERVVGARRDPDRVLLEGVHALKHALRFGADVEVVATDDPLGLTALLEQLAPDVRSRVESLAVVFDEVGWQRIAPRPLPSPALSVARHPHPSPAAVLAAPGRLLVLDRPRHLGNLGACIRVAAAAGAGGVLVVGEADPWHQTAVRAAAGLQFALPTARMDALPALDRPVVALDPAGEALHQRPLPDDAVLLVGTERGGLDPELRARADERRAIEMRTGVSSLNLATAVAIALYAGR
ncbi:MAG: TrmH family RNA methyltransferase [Nitriliruptoraceae bacterium]